MLLDFNNFKVRVALMTSFKEQAQMFAADLTSCWGNSPEILRRRIRFSRRPERRRYRRRPSPTGQRPPGIPIEGCNLRLYGVARLESTGQWGPMGGLKPHHPLIFACLFFTKLRTYTTWSMPWLGFIFSVYNLEALGYDNFYHAWFHFPTTLCPRDWEKTIWTTLGSNPACQLSKQPRYPLHASPL